MRIFTLLLPVALMASAAVAGEPAVKRVIPLQGKAAIASETVSLGKMKAPKKVADDKPTSGRAYAYDNGEWVLSYTQEMKYNANGDVTETVSTATDGSGVTVEKNTYDSQNRLVESLIQTGANTSSLVNSERSVKDYDDVVEDFAVMEGEYTWDGGAWVATEESSMEVDRDADKNVVAIVVNSLVEDATEPTKTQEINYEYADGKAVSMSGKAYEEDFYEGGYVWRDETATELQWDCTDGQLLGDLKQALTGTNRLAYGKFSDWQGDYQITNTYEGDGVVYVSKWADFLDDGTIQDYATRTKTLIDENGSTREEASYEGVDYKVWEETRYDSHGNMVDYSAGYTYFGTESLYEETHVDYTYDAEGNITEMVVTQLDEETFEMVPSYKIEYFYGTSGVNTVGVDADSREVVFDIAGHVVSSTNMAPGIYIKKQGDKVVKFVKR